nr:PREDICTED: longitudinals lacking protein, isoforms A/B/D/L-like [Linepithema humile]
MSNLFVRTLRWSDSAQKDKQWRQRGIYSCPNSNCNKSFNWKGNLSRHLRYECGLLPRFKCPYCTYCCKVKADVSKHITRKHKNATVYVLDIKNSFGQRS